MTLDLDAIKARKDAATPGPWKWAGYTDGSIELRTVGQGGRRIVTTVRTEPCLVELPGEDWSVTADACDSCLAESKKTMDPWLNYRCPKEANLDTVWLHDNDGDLIRPANVWAVRERPYRNDVASVDHPDAEFIAHARQDIDDLVAEVEALRAALSQDQHVLALDDEGWSIEHLVSCRPYMTECGYHQAVADWAKNWDDFDAVAPVPNGRYALELNPDGTPLIGERIG